jgi:hypothetical protein
MGCIPPRGSLQQRAVRRGKVQGGDQPGERLALWRAIDAAFQGADAARTDARALGQGFLRQSGRDPVALERVAKVGG